MRNKLKAVRNWMLRAIRYFWGKRWRLRSYFINYKHKVMANDFLMENQSRMVFILGSGRSGTQLLSELFNVVDSVSAFHEPDFNEDVGTMSVFKKKPELAVDYWRLFRQVKIYDRWLKSPDAKFYFEVNGTIRYQTHAICELFPQAKLFLVSRDGRGVVRSIMGWQQFYGPGSRGAFALQPLHGDKFEDEWLNMSRFEKICWMWVDANEYVMKYVPEDQWLQIERLATEYDYFTGRLCEKAGVHVQKEVWFDATSKRSRNASKSYVFPSWNEWSAEQKDTFIRICEPTMSRLGYETNN